MRFDHFGSHLQGHYQLDVVDVNCSDFNLKWKSPLNLIQTDVIAAPIVE